MSNTSTSGIEVNTVLERPCERLERGRRNIFEGGSTTASYLLCEVLNFFVFLNVFVGVVLNVVIEGEDGLSIVCHSHLHIQRKISI